MQEGTDQWETARQDLTDTIRYRTMLTENEKQLANVRSGLELKLKNRRLRWTSRPRRTAAGPGAGCSPPAAVRAAGAGKEHGRLPELGQGRHARRRGPPPAGHHRAGVGHPEGGAWLRSGRGDRRWARPCRTSWWKTKPRPRRPLPCCAATMRAAPPSCRWTQCSPGCSGGTVRLGTAGLQPGPGRCTVT